MTCWAREARVRNIAAYNDLKYDDILRRMKVGLDEDRTGVPEAACRTSSSS